MKIIYTRLILCFATGYFLFSGFHALAQNNVGIGTLSPDSSAILELKSSGKGFLVPRMTAVQRQNISTPAKGLLVFDTDTNCLFYYSTTIGWLSLCQSSGPTGPTGLTGPIGLTGATGAQGPTGPTNVDSLVVQYASFDSVLINVATIDSIFANYINVDSLYAAFASFDSVFINTAIIDSLIANYISTDTILASYANFDSLFIAGVSIDSFVANVIDTVAWKQKGNTGTSPAVNFLGTIDSVALVIRTNNTEQMRITSSGKVGIGNTVPAEKLEVTGNARITGLAGSGIVLAEADSSGTLQKKPYSGNATDVLTGNGNWTPVNSVAIPTGVIVMWSGTQASIPNGWALCNGTNGTPDLRDRFILSVADTGTSYDVGATGGAHNYNLSVAQLPSHSFTGTTSSDGNHSHGAGTLANSTITDHTHTLSAVSTNTTGSHSHGGSVTSVSGHTHGLRGSNSFSGGGDTFETDDSSNDQPRTSDVGGGSQSLTISADGSHTHTLSGSSDAAGSHAHTISGSTASDGPHTHTLTTNFLGSGTAIDNRPMFYKLAFIMKL